MSIFYEQYQTNILSQQYKYYLYEQNQGYMSTNLRDYISTDDALCL
jgi:hypothetical protein